MATSKYVLVKQLTAENKTSSGDTETLQNISLSKSVMDMLKEDIPEKKSLERLETAHPNAALAMVTRASAGSVMVPPPIDLFPSRVMTLRYQTGANAISVGPTITQLLALYGCVATSSTNAYPIHSRIKLRKITIWPAGGSIALVSWVDSGSFFSTGEKTRLDDIPAGVSLSRKLVFIPPKDGVSSKWLAPSSNTIFLLTLGLAGSVVDIECELSQAVVTNTTAVTSTAMTAGKLYYGYLANANFPPEGVLNATVF